MLLICPECRAPLTAGAWTATCTTHGGQYELLFDREAESTRRSAEVPAAPLPDAPPPPPEITAKCKQHPDVDAVARCHVCGGNVCSVCDFALPGGVHACPTCIESHHDQEISPARKKKAWLALGIAALATFIVILALSGSLHRMFGATTEDEAINTLVGNLMLWPAIAGLGVAFTSFDRRLGNNGVIWTAVIWNSTLAGIFILLMIIGLVTG